jgi:hypothetical protein
MWLRDSLPGDFPNLRIITHGYHSALDQNPSTHEVEDFGRDFADQLRIMRSFVDVRMSALQGDCVVWSDFHTVRTAAHFYCP